MALHNSTGAIRRQARRRYDRQFKSMGPLTKLRPVMVPDDVERRDSHAPCFRCGEREGCRHRQFA